MKKNILFTTLTVSLIVIISKIIGFAREALIAAYFGANASTDAYFLAQSMPSMIFPAVCTSLSTAFLSVYVKKRLKYGEVTGNRFLSKALKVSLIFALLLSIIAFVMMPIVIPIIAPGFNETTTQLAIVLSRITMASFVLTMAQYMLTAILNSKKLFYGAQISGVISNVIVIVIVFFFGQNQSIEFLTWTVVSGLFIQVCILFFMTYENDVIIVKTSKWLDKDIKTMIKLSMPILLGNSVVQINIIVDKALASNLEEGAVSALSYSNSLNSIVISVLIMSLSTVLYPTLAENVSNNDITTFNNNILQNLTLLVLITIPVSIITLFYSTDIVSFVFERGEFNNSATLLTSYALSFYAIGFPFIAIREVITRGFYALGDSKKPMIIGFYSVGLNIILSLTLVKYLNIGGIALATSIATSISAIFLLFSLKKKMHSLSISSLTKTLLKILLASLVTIFSLFYIGEATVSLSPFFRILIGTLFGFIVYSFTLIILKCHEIIILLNLLKRKFHL